MGFSFADVLSYLGNIYNGSGQSDYDVAYSNQPTPSQQTPSSLAGKQKEKTGQPASGGGTFEDFLSRLGGTSKQKEEQPSYTPVQQAAPAPEESEQESKAFKKSSDLKEKKNTEKQNWTDYWSQNGDTQQDLFMEYLNNGAGYESFGGGGKIPEKSSSISDAFDEAVGYKTPEFKWQAQPSDYTAAYGISPAGLLAQLTDSMHGNRMLGDVFVDPDSLRTIPTNDPRVGKIIDERNEKEQEQARKAAHISDTDMMPEVRDEQSDLLSLGNQYLQEADNAVDNTKPDKPDVTWKNPNGRSGWQNGDDVLRDAMERMGFSDEEIETIMSQSEGSRERSWYDNEYQTALNDLYYKPLDNADKTYNALAGDSAAQHDREYAASEAIYNAAMNVIPKIAEKAGVYSPKGQRVSDNGRVQLGNKLEKLNNDIQAIRSYENAGDVLTKTQRDQLKALEEEYAQTKKQYDETPADVFEYDQRMGDASSSVETALAKVLNLPRKGYIPEGSGGRGTTTQEGSTGGESTLAAASVNGEDQQIAGTGTGLIGDQLKEFDDWRKTGAADEFFKRYGDLNRDDPLLFSKLRILANENMWKDLYGYGDIQGVDGWRDYLWGDDINPDDEDAWNRFWDAISNIRALRRSDIYGEDARSYAGQGTGNVATNLWAFAQSEEGRRLLGNLFDSENMLKYLTSDPSMGGAGMSKADSNDLIAWGLLSRLSHGGFEGYSYDQLKDLANTFLELSGDEMRFGGPGEEGFERQNWRSNRHEGPYSWNDLSAGSKKLNAYDSGNILDWNALDTWQAYLDEAARREGLSPDDVVYLGRRA